MPNDWQGEERRSHPRVRLEVPGSAPSEIVPTLVVDVSLSGALLEVASSLPTRTRYVVHLTLEDGRAVSLEGEVVRSYVHGFEKDASGLPAVKYRAAIRFVDLEPGERGLLEELIQAGGKGQAEVAK
jgi:hypothetical protein